MTSVNDDYITIEDGDGLVDLGEQVSFDEDYMIVLSEEELLALGNACSRLADAFRQLGEAIPPVVEQVSQMAKDVQ